MDKSKYTEKGLTILSRTVSEWTGVTNQQAETINST